VFLRRWGWGYTRDAWSRSRDVVTLVGSTPWWWAHMKREPSMKSVTTFGMLVLTGGVLVFGSAAVAARPRPQPDCGPTRQWTCALPGCPECYEVLFEGTVCEKAAFEKQTGRVCTPDGG